MKTRNASHQTPLALAPSEKYISHGGKNCKNTYEVYYWRHSTTTSGRAHRETVCLVKIEARQRCTPAEKGVGVLPNEKECSKEVVKSFI